MAGLLDNLVTIGGTIIAGGLLLKATDIMFQKPKGKPISLYDRLAKSKKTKKLKRVM
jgi:hypothetical protein